MHAFPMFPVATNGNVVTGSPTLSGAPCAPTSRSHNWGDAGNISMMAASSGIAAGSAITVNLSSSAAPAPASADSILDDAVDEIFNNTGLPENVGDLDDLWDSDGFGETNDVGIIENDLQLGNLLESFLEQS